MSQNLSRRLVKVGLALVLFATSLPAYAGKLAWLDEVVQDVVREAEAGGKVAARVGSEAAGSRRMATRLFANEAEQGLEVVARRHEALTRGAARGADAASESLLQSRFARLVGAEPELAKTFSALAPAEKRLVVEMGEAAQTLAKRYPGQAETMIRSLGTEGLSAVRVVGDDAAEIIIKEGPASIGVLRRTGRDGWEFFTKQVLPNKGKLAAAGVLTAFLANPEKFIDTAGRVTEYAVTEFGKAGIQLVGAVSTGVARGLESSIGQMLETYGLNVGILRYAGMGLAGVVILGSTLVLLGLPIRWLMRPFTWPVKMLLGRRKVARV